MAKKQLFKGRPDFPNEEPLKITSPLTTNDTDEVYCIDTKGVEATFVAGMKKINTDGSKSASAWASGAFTGVLYGRWTNVGADVELACYVIDNANSES